MTQADAANPTASSAMPYQLVFLQGISPDKAAHLGNRVVSFALDSPDIEAALDIIRDPDLNTSDTKTTALFVTAGDISNALVAYSATVGFAGRFLDVAAYPALERLSVLVATGRRIAREAEAGLAGTRPQRIDRLRIAPTAEPDTTTIVYNTDDPLQVIDIHTAKRIRFARRVEVVPPDDMASAFRLFAAVAGLRSTVRADDRLPSLVVAGSDAGQDTVVDLEALRSEARKLRHHLKLPDLAQLVEAPSDDPIHLRIAAARELPMAPVLIALGSQQAPTGDYWRCPRPARHANGDKNPSMKVADNRVRCFVCDAEWVDPVALTMSVEHMAPTEAATLVAQANAH